MLGAYGRCPGLIPLSVARRAGRITRRLSPPVPLPEASPVPTPDTLLCILPASACARECANQGPPAAVFVQKFLCLTLDQTHFPEVFLS